MPDDESPILAALGLDTADLPAPPADLWDAALAAAFDPAATSDPDTVPDMDDTIPADDDLQLVVDEPDDTTTSALHADGPISTTGGEDFGDASVDPNVVDDGGHSGDDQPYLDPGHDDPHTDGSHDL
ncbi:hypothetical protein MTX80_23110 (plasmid) [Gordonia amicalis]|nr:hypothetical protein [Gordonia amicalis]UOG23811.1 hypothetical protein MTX80_23110 [Gordonia amicalis]